MNKKSIYCNYVDLAWYFAARSLCDCTGLYHFDEFAPPIVVNVSEILYDLNHPDEVSLERFRAMALCFAGTDFETFELRKAIEDRIMEENDVFCLVALSAVDGGSQHDLALRILLGAEQKTFEEEVFALTAFKEQDTLYPLTPIMERIEHKLPAALKLAIGNECLFQFLFDVNEESHAKSQTVSLLNKFVHSIPTEDAKHRVHAAGLRWVDVCVLIWTMRTSLSKYNRMTKRSPKELLQTALAGSVRTWDDQEKLLVREVGPALGARIDCPENYVWYKETYGMSFPELLLNVKDKVFLSRVLPALDDTERCLLASQLQLKKTEAKGLKLKFSEWNPDLQEYWESFKPGRSSSHLYKIGGMSYDDVVTTYGCDSEEAFIWVEQHLDSAESGQVVEVLPVAFEKSYYMFNRLVNRFDLEDALTERQAQVHDELAYYGKEQDRLMGLPLQYVEFINNDEVFSAVVAEALGDSECATIAQHLRVTTTLLKAGFPIQDTVELLNGDDDDMSTLLRFIHCGATYEDFLAYKNSTLDQRTTELCQIAQDYHSKEVRKWLRISIFDCLSWCWDVAYGLQKIASRICSAKYDKKYEMIMRFVLKEWIFSGTPVMAMNRCHSLTSLVGGKTEWDELWLCGLSKDITAAESLTDMEVNHGIYAGVECWFTSKGIITKEVTEELKKQEIPVWKLDDDGEKLSVFVGAPIAEAFEFIDGQEIAFDSMITITAVRV